MNAMPPLEADGTQLATFFEAMFRYADENTFISLRAFYDDRDGVFAITGHSIPADARVLLPVIEAFANRCAAASSRVVCCPPIAAFRDSTHATEADLVNGLALSVECDRTPSDARVRLENLLGPATIVVESGGEWMRRGRARLSRSNICIGAYPNRRAARRIINGSNGRAF